MVLQPPGSLCEVVCGGNYGVVKLEEYLGKNELLMPNTCRKISRAVQVYVRISLFSSSLVKNRCGSYLFISPSVSAHLCFLVSLSVCLLTLSLHFSVVGCGRALFFCVINLSLKQYLLEWLVCMVTLALQNPWRLQ